MTYRLCKHTAIIIAHRLTTVKNVDRILVFDNGDIVEEGNFTELANGNGLFRQLLDTPDEKEELPV
jgi:ATP-binding cassette subfamily B protein